MERIGGSMRSEVTRARHRALGHIVAIKRLLPHAQEAPEERQRFIEECALMLDLCHPGLVTGLERLHGPQGPEDLCLVMPFIEGAPMSALMTHERIPPEDAIAHAGFTLASALSGLHTAGGGALVHGDISARNVLIDAAGTLSVIDLSSAGPHGAMPRDAGTPRYRAPERQLGAPLTTQGDVYALGVLLWELSAGRRWPAETPTQLPDSSPLAGSALEALIMRCIASTPEERPAHAGALLSELEPLTSPGGPTAWRAWVDRSYDASTSPSELSPREGLSAWVSVIIAFGLAAWVGLWFIAQMT